MTDTILRPTLSYLLRLWAERDGEHWQWRVSLQAIPGKHPMAFGSFDQALQFLHEQMEQKVQLGTTGASDYPSLPGEGTPIPFDKE